MSSSSNNLHQIVIGVTSPHFAFFTGREAFLAGASGSENGSAPQSAFYAGEEIRTLEGTKPQDILAGEETEFLSLHPHFLSSLTSNSILKAAAFFRESSLKSCPFGHSLTILRKLIFRKRFCALALRKKASREPRQ